MYWPLLPALSCMFCPVGIAEELLNIRRKINFYSLPQIFLDYGYLKVFILMNDSLTSRETLVSSTTSLNLVTDIIKQSLSVEVDNSESQHRTTITLALVLGKNINQGLDKENALKVRETDRQNIVTHVTFLCSIMGVDTRILKIRCSRPKI